MAQRLLEMNVNWSLRLMGVGSGASPDTSGERAIFKLLKRAASGNTPLCVFDVGANKGQFLRAAFESLSGSRVHIHAFEPGAATFSELSQNAASLADVTLNNVACGREPGELTLYYDKPGSGLASLTQRRLDHFGVAFAGSEKVAVDTIDRYCAANGIERIDLLKLDVEGHELDVLKGASDMFANQRIDMVSFEFGGCNIDTRTFFQDYYYFFNSVGMKALFRLTPSEVLVPIREYSELHEQFRTTNFVALRE